MILQKRFFFLATIFITIPFWHGHAQSHKQDLSIWPKAETGYKRVVIRLPSLKTEENARVELIPQKRMQVDCNLLSIHGTIQTKTITGWGYSYYYLDKITEPVSTFMACPKNTSHEAAVPILTDLSFLPYNSKLPIVVYIPKKLDLSYRIWIAQPLRKGNEQ